MIVDCSGSGFGDAFAIGSDGNEIRGLQILNSPGNGIGIYAGASNNTIADNVISGHAFSGVGIMGSGTTANLVIGNKIGTDAGGTAALGGNYMGGISLDDGPQYNTIGGSMPDERNLISGNSGDGVSITGGGTDHNAVRGNYFGTSADGLAAIPNEQAGIFISNGPQHNIIGGSAPGEGNVISGNAVGVAILSAHYNTVAGNRIGTDAAGANAIPNDWGIGISSGAQFNTVGGTTSLERNVISGNSDPTGGPGIWIDGLNTDHNLVIGNYIGTDASGTAAIPNNGGGVAISGGASYNVVGGDTPAERNVISGNQRAGIGISGDNNLVIGNYIGTDLSGAAPLGNEGGVGIEGTHNRVGGSTPGERNIISGNNMGAVYIGGSETMSNTLSGNLIGADASGMMAIPNGWGVEIWDSAHHNTVGGDAPGEGNLLSGNLGDGIVIRDGGTMSNIISGNLIGTNINGTAALANAGHGISMGFAASYNIIGGNSPGARNVISGNGEEGVHIDCNDVVSTTISGNFIGTDLTGAVAVGNAGHGIGLDCFAQHNVISGNLISGNGGDGISLNGNDTQGNIISGNYIGTDLNGTQAVGNAGQGVAIDGYAHNTFVGGTTAGSGNLISGNGSMAVFVRDSSDNRIVGNLIGTDASGTARLPNVAGVGIYWDSQNNLVENNVITSDFFGVQIALADAAENVVRGNWIGTSEDGLDLGNTWGGIEITSDAWHNTIGPDNVIAYNDGPGVVVNYGGHDNTLLHNEIAHNAGNGVAIEGASSVRNTIIVNSIHHNGLVGIELVEGGNTELDAPVVTVYDVGAGTASGSTCPYCRVEVFTDDQEEGRWFEGVVTATMIGSWSFDKGSAFVGPNVRPTATDSEGNTSEFGFDLHDMAVVGATPHGEVAVGTATGVRAELFNAGSQFESGVPVICSIEDPSSNTIYSETRASGDVPPATWAIVSFPDWTPATEGQYTLACQSMLAGDTDPTNDLFTRTLTATLDVPDVWTKDNDTDNGEVPSSYPWWWSPDLWLRNQPDGGLAHQNPVPGMENTIYVRLRNRGTRIAAWGQVHLFAGPSKLGWPCLSSAPDVGTISFTNLAPGEERVVSLAWVPDGGPFQGLRSVIEADGDPVQWQPGCSPHQPRFDNNISWRNVHVIDNRADRLRGTLGARDASVVLNNIYDRPYEMDVIAERMTFPASGTITMTLPEQLFDRWLASDGYWFEGIEVLTATKEILVTGPISATVGALPMLAGEEATMALHFQAATGQEFELGLEVRMHGLTVGGVIYQWVILDEEYGIYLPLVLHNH